MLTLVRPGVRSLRGGTLLLVLALLPATGLAQDFRGAIAGRISDDSGGVLPGVTVAVTHRDTNVTTTTVTNDTGNYSLLYLPPGTYSVSA